MKKQNLNALYPHPYPYVVDVVPPVIHNPISVLYFLCRWIFAGNTSPEYTAEYVDGVVRCVGDAREGLWKMGFFGKGILSRSEPSWDIRTKRRLGLHVEEGVYAPEEVTQFRREQRQHFKAERAKAEEDELKRRQDIDRGLAVADKNDDDKPVRPEFDRDAFLAKSYETARRTEDDEVVDKDGNLVDIEFLQLMDVEALFLHMAFGLKVGDMDVKSMVQEFSRKDPKFLTYYAVYHHYRSLGWCVRSGIKFGADFLLYKKGPPFTHAEFCIKVMPKDDPMPDFWWQSNLCRVIGGVKKTTVFCFVDSPKVEGEVDEGKLVEVLKGFKVREVVYRRWIPSRNRD